ncbi:repetitive organellar protein [Phymastichus coffea]|uniref:repetitive organellar protein n=1 Tax=Phymastichus coffea TaxID=108790 RepID=UPI00273CB8CA|nr:repetitive organellar protein [Phymastichus coffea]XP_058804905.1 repetitive organellar protein [Phymastichus coffea]XP_058804906.1 repetitive organellar protein [Phymastichus coffea]
MNNKVAKMTRAVKRKRIIVESDSDNEDSNNRLVRRSSLKVNLSFTSNVSDSGESNSDHELLKKKSEETTDEENEGLTRTVKYNTNNVVSNDPAIPVSIADDTIINAVYHKICKKWSSRNPRLLMSDMEKKEQQLNKSCIELQNAIINKTKSLLDNELSKRTSEILTGCSNMRQIYNDNHENRSPSVRVDVGKNDQIVMAGCGEKQNPVRVNIMSSNTHSEKNDKVSQNSDPNDLDCNQSIISTPKKFNTEILHDKSLGKTSMKMIKMPVIRLFADNNPDNSMSEINYVLTPKNSRLNISKDNEANNRTKPVVSNELNITVSPILSQGTRRTRISRHSLRRKLITSNDAETSRFSINITNENSINRLPLTCSSFIERSEKPCNKSNSNQLTKTIILEEQSELNENQKTINLDENDTNTINIDHSSNRLSMEITAISARTPIVRKTFQEIIQKSLKLNATNLPYQKNKKLCKLNQRSMNGIDSSINKTNESCSANTGNENGDQDNCSVNTLRTSLSVNTSLDDVSLAERITQKEIRRLDKTNELIEQTSKNNIARENQPLITMRSSLHVNTSLDSIRKSSDSSKTDCEQEKIKNKQLPLTSSNNNKEIKKNTEKIIRLSNGTARSSMQMNTSLDSVQKSPNTQEPLNYNKILSMVEEISCQSSNDDSETENIPLLERIQINGISKHKITANKQDNLKETTSNTNKGILILDSERKSNTSESADPLETPTTTQKNESKRIRKSCVIRKSNLLENDSKNSELSVRRKYSRKSKNNSVNRSSTTSESSVVEATPFPASRSLLFKTIIKNNIVMNTLNPKKLVDNSDNDDNDGLHLTVSKTNSSLKKRNNVQNNKTILHSDDSLDTVIVNSSDESSNESNMEKERIVICESMNDTGNQNKSKINKSKSKKQIISRNSDSSDEDEKNRKVAIKRKLYPLRENSQISFSPVEISESPRESAPKKSKTKKRRKMTQKTQDVKALSPEVTETSDHTENEISLQNLEKKKMKRRKIKSKKIIVKKVNNMTLLDNILENNGEISLTTERNSLREFNLRKARVNAHTKNHKIVIVVTGLDEESKDLVKSVVKSLGSATLQANVTPRTTHVISSGVRTINLLKGIIRGCWLLQLEWVLKSLESGKWLDPLPYEMSHFAKAVQINRRDRKLCGIAYIPELFVTCGLIYIENGTTPPAATLKELVKTAGGSITEDPNKAKIIVGMEGLKENWILDSITTGEIQRFDQYRQN